MKSLKFHVVMTPNGDRPYVSINKPQSYIDHLDASGEKAEVFTIETMLPSDVDGVILGGPLTNGAEGRFSFVARRIR